MQICMKEKELKFIISKSISNIFLIDADVVFLVRHAGKKIKEKR